MIFTDLGIWQPHFYSFHLKWLNVKFRYSVIFVSLAIEEVLWSCLSMIPKFKLVQKHSLSFHCLLVISFGLILGQLGTERFCSLTNCVRPHLALPHMPHKYLIKDVCWCQLFILACFVSNESYGEAVEDTTCFVSCVLCMSSCCVSYCTLLELDTVSTKIWFCNMLMF